MTQTNNMNKCNDKDQWHRPTSQNRTKCSDSGTRAGKTRL